MITLCKEDGGLGIRQLDIMNQACLMKLGWKMINKANDLRCRILQSKYRVEEFQHGNQIKSSNSQT